MDNAKRRKLQAIINDKAASDNEKDTARKMLAKYPEEPIVKTIYDQRFTQEFSRDNLHDDLFRTMYEDMILRQREAQRRMSEDLIKRAREMEKRMAEQDRQRQAQYDKQSEEISKGPSLYEAILILVFVGIFVRVLWLILIAFISN